MKKRIMCFALALLLCMAVAVPVHAVESAVTPREAADYLYERGLFKGAGMGQDGKPIYNLEQTATRGEGITMFVRLLGKESEAAANAYTIPFTDVPAWASGYVGYAYENGLTKGTGATAFSTANHISAYEFLTLCLRALGYREGTDFTWDSPNGLAAQIGIIGAGDWQDNGGVFTRGDMAVISYRVLQVKMPVAGVTEVDAGDRENQVLNNDGQYVLSLNGLPDGSIITRDDLVYTPGAAAKDNLSNFTTILHEINPNLSWTGKGVEYGGNTLTYINAANGLWTLRVSRWDDGKDHRNLLLTSMTYFGDKDMASAVWGMLNEHYTARADTSTPIPAEMAGRYGLTILSETTSESGRISISVTNGSATWTIIYDVENPLGSKEAIVRFPIR